MSLLNASIENSLALSEWLSQQLHEHANESLGQRSMMTVALASLALEHREACLLLVYRGARPTAMAVARLVLESYVRALWVWHLASDQQLVDFMRDRFDPKIESTLQKLRRAAEPHGQLFEILRRHYCVLHDYVHGGPRQVSRWIRPGEITPRYSDEQMAEVLSLVDMLGLMAAASRERVQGWDAESLEGRVRMLIQSQADRKRQARGREA